MWFLRSLTLPARQRLALLVPRIHVVLRLSVIDLLRRVDAVEVLLQVRVAVAVHILGSVGGVVRIQPVLLLPLVRDAVAVAVEGNRFGLVLRPTADVSRRV